MGNKKLAAVCTGSGIGHGQLAGTVEHEGIIDFITEFIPGAACSVPLGISALDHEIVNNTGEISDHRRRVRLLLGCSFFPRQGR